MLYAQQTNYNHPSNGQVDNNMTRSGRVAKNHPLPSANMQQSAHQVPPDSSNHIISEQQGTNYPALQNRAKDHQGNSWYSQQNTEKQSMFTKIRDNLKSTFDLKQLWRDSKNYASLTKREKKQVMFKTFMVTCITMMLLAVMASILVNILLGTCHHKWEQSSCQQEICVRCGDTRWYNGTHQGVPIDTLPQSCTQKGYTLYHCTVCNEDYEDDYVQATGHSTKNGVCSYCMQTITLADSCELKKPIMYSKYSHKNAVIFSTAELISLEHQFIPYAGETVILTIAANFKKTYDYQGQNSNMPISFIWRLYNSSGQLVDGETVTSQGLLIGQEADLTIATNPIPIGQYRLEFSDYGQ